MRRRTVAVLGATGAVGQRFISLLADHPWFELTALTASDAKAGQRFGDVAGYGLPGGLPDRVADMRLEQTRPEIDAEICFSALPNEAADEWENALARAGHHVFTNASPHRMDADVPLLIGEVNHDHVRALERQRTGRGWSGSIVANGNCSAVQLALSLAPLHRDFGVQKVLVATMQSLSGAGYPGVASLDALDNVVPYIGGEEEKMVEETRKFLGGFDGTRFVPADMAISASCNRVSVRDGHTQAVSVSLRERTSVDELKRSLREFRGRPQEMRLPSAPERPILVREEANRPQPVLDRDAGRGMTVVVGRVREDPILGYKFVGLGHNTIRGAAGSSVLNAELLLAEGCLGG